MTNSSAASAPADRLSRPPATPAAPAGPWRRRLARLVAAASGLNLAAVLLLWVMLAAARPTWWPMTLVYYGPRWAWALPTLVLAPFALGLRGRPRMVVFGLLLGSAAVAFGPVMGLCLCSPFGGTADPAPFHLRILTGNLDGHHLNVAAFDALLDAAAPDVVAAQECAAPVRRAIRWPRGWHVLAPEGGLCVASRFPLAEMQPLSHRDLGAWGYAAHVTLRTPGGRVHFVNLHLPTPREGITGLLRHGPAGTADLREATAAQAHASAVARRWADGFGDPCVLAGDFNLPADHPAFRRDWGSFADAFAAAGLGYGYTKFTRWHGARIDHVLTGPGWHCRSCRVGPDVGSDHRPLVADLDWVGAGD